MKKFMKNPANPVFGGPAVGTMFDVLIQPYSGEPTALEHPRFRMDVSWRPKHSLVVSFSEDGVKWTEPEITLSADPSTGWEDDVNRHGVVKIGNKYRMWYTGQYRDYNYSSIGVAESDDGIHFSRLPHRLADDEKENLDPVLVAERNWEGESVMNPCVLYENGTYRMYYAAGETFEPNVLALATSTDGINWKRDRINPIYRCNPNKPYEQERVGGCQVVPVEGLGYLMFYIGYQDISTACICCALSKDGRTEWRRCKGNPLIAPTPNSWDADACYKPSAVYDDQLGGWRIWYNGRNGSPEYIGEAFMEGTFSEEDFE